MQRLEEEIIVTNSFCNCHEFMRKVEGKAALARILLAKPSPPQCSEQQSVVADAAAEGESASVLRGVVSVRRPRHQTYCSSQTEAVMDFVTIAIDRGRALRFSGDRS